MRKLYRVNNTIIFDDKKGIRHHLDPSDVTIKELNDGKVAFSFINMNKIPETEVILVSELTDGTGKQYPTNPSGQLPDSTFTNPSIVALDTNNPAGDAFGRLRVSEPVTIFDSKKLYGLSEGTYWSAELGGAGTRAHDPANSCVNMSVVGAGDYVIRQTKQRFNYQPGKSMLYYLTATLNPTVGTTQRVGAFHGGIIAPYDAIDGLCFELEGESMAIKVYKNGVATVNIPSTSWSKDKMDGSGPSGIIADWSKSHIFIIDYEWLGVGRVRYGININGVTHYVHEVNNANNVTAVYMRSPNQPVRYEIRSTGGAATMQEICCSVQSEGGFNPAGLQALVGMGNTSISIGSGWEMMYAVRLKDTNLDAAIEVQNIDVMTISNVNYEWGLFWNPIIGGATNWVSPPGASIETWVGDGSTNIITPIIQMAGGYSERSTRSVAESLETSLKLGAEINGTQDVIALGARTLSGIGDFVGSMQLKSLT